MNRKIDIIGLISLILTILTLIFGDNIYQQIKGQSFFQNSQILTPTSTDMPIGIFTVSSETQVEEVSTPELIKEMPVPTLTKEIFATDVGMPEHPVKVLFLPSVDANTIVTGGEILVNFLGEITNLNFEIVIPTSAEATIEEICLSPTDTMGFIPSLDRFARPPCDVNVAFIAIRSGQGIPSETISFGLEFPVDLQSKIEEALNAFSHTSDWRRSVGGTDFYGWDGITLAP